MKKCHQKEDFRSNRGEEEKGELKTSTKAKWIYYGQET